LESAIVLFVCNAFLDTHLLLFFTSEAKQFFLVWLIMDKSWVTPAVHAGIFHTLSMNVPAGSSWVRWFIRAVSLSHTPYSQA